MSWRTPCNWCNLARIMESCSPGGSVIVRDVPSKAFPKARVVYVVPHDVEVDLEDDEQMKPYWRAWFAELTKECACDLHSDDW